MNFVGSFAEDRVDYDADNRSENASGKVVEGAEEEVRDDENKHPSQEGCLRSQCISNQDDTS